MEKVFLESSRRVLSGHLWIFSNEIIERPQGFEAGGLVEIYDKGKRFLGIGYLNPYTLIAIRLLTRRSERIDSDFFRKRINRALEYRKRFIQEGDSMRVIYSEGDFLPGLIVDKYDKSLVIQFLTAGMENMRDTILTLLDDIFSPSTIILRNDIPSRELECLPVEKEVVKGKPDPLPIIKEGDIMLEIDPINGQKTGFFLDQRENRLYLRDLSLLNAWRDMVKGGKGLDLFCYSGAWGLHLAKNGAYVTGVDESGVALSMARRNIELNGLKEKYGFEKDDVFSFLRGEADKGNLYDFVILDPPAFVKSRFKIPEGIRGYRDINRLAMKVVKKGGIIATSSCSYHINRTAFLDIIARASRDSGRSPRLFDFRTQSKDHPILPQVPETEYLKCAFLVMD